MERVLAPIAHRAAPRHRTRHHTRVGSRFGAQLAGRAPTSPSAKSSWNTRSVTAAGNHGSARTATDAVHGAAIHRANGPPALVDRVHASRCQRERLLQVRDERQLRVERCAPARAKSVAPCAPRGAAARPIERQQHRRSLVREELQSFAQSDGLPVARRGIDGVASRAQVREGEAALVATQHADVPVVRDAPARRVVALEPARLVPQLNIRGSGRHEEQHEPRERRDHRGAQREQERREREAVRQQQIQEQEADRQAAAERQRLEAERERQYFESLTPEQQQAYMAERRARQAAQAEMMTELFILLIGSGDDAGNSSNSNTMDDCLRLGIRSRACGTD